MHAQVRRARVLAHAQGGGGNRFADPTRTARAVDAAARSPYAESVTAPRTAATACACDAGEEGRASPCAASNVAVRVDVAQFQFGALRHRRRALGLYSSRYLATTG